MLDRLKHNSKIFKVSDFTIGFLKFVNLKRFNHILEYFPSNEKPKPWSIPAGIFYNVAVASKY